MEKIDADLAIGSDHAAFRLKEILKQYLTGNGYVVHDTGAFSEKSVDYPDFGAKVASMVSRGEINKGILLCGTGIGMSMVANRFHGVRAALCNDLFSAEMSRRHNDANILVIGGRVVGDELALAILRTWLVTPFDGGRHTGRIEKIEIKPERYWSAQIGKEKSCRD